MLGLPQVLVDGHAPLSLSDAFFTATSAVCVTGLTVVDTANTFSPLGHGLLLALFQLGGLGVMTLALLVFEFFSKQFSEERQDVFESSLGEKVWDKSSRSTLHLVLIYTFTIEAIGFLILLPSFWGTEHGALQALFLSVSAFCNAGFDNIPGGLSQFNHDWSLTLCLSGLWILGAFGFMVPALKRRRELHGPSAPKDPALQMLLRAGIFLMFLGPLLFWFFERNHLLADFSWDQQLLVSWFQGNTTRTAGFSLVDLSNASRAGLLAMIPFMLIGGAPGGTAGGVKTTTAWIFFATMLSHVRKQRHVIIFDRRIPTFILRRTVLIVGMMACLWGVITMLLVILDQDNLFSLEQLAFESASALGTVGLSAGVTAKLSLGSKMLLSLAMFIGRLGPLTIAFLLFQRQSSDRLEYQQADIPVG